MTDFGQELEAAVAERDEIQAALGQAIIDGKPTEAIKKQLRAALTAVDDAEAAQAAIAAASARASAREAEKAVAEAEAKRAERRKQAETDVHDLHATVAAKDRLLEKLRELNEREAHQARALANNYADLGMSAAVASELSLRSWNGQLVQRLKSDCGLGSFLPRLLTYGVAGKAVASCVPAFERIFPRREKQKEAA